MKTVAFHTLGCKVNTYESNAMLKIFNEAGYQEVDFKQVADVYVINTCTVTNTGDSKSRQMIRKAIRKNPKATICVVGCYSQTAPEEIEKIEGVGVVLGTQYRSDIVKYVDEHLETGEMVIKVDNVMNLRKFEDLNIDRFKNTRAFLKIQDGCNNFCTYCIIPYARGRVRSRQKESVLNQAQRLVDNGYVDPKATICVVGCYSQTAPEEIEKIEGVGVVLGTQYRSDIVKYVDEHLETGEMVIKVDNVMNLRKFEDLNIDRFKNTRAFLKIQDGCNNFCTYCIIPYARGRVRSRQKESVLNQAQRLVDNGYVEIVLTGIHTAGYGEDLDDYSFYELLVDLVKIKGLKRLRISSIETSQISDEIIDLIGSNEIIVDHLHVPLQAGSDATLKRMNRKYTTAEYLEKINKIRSYLPNIAFTTDVIVGFPGETDEEFEETYNFIKQVNYSELHVFPYSPRKNTPAAKMKDQVNDQIKHERANRLLQLSKELNHEFALKQIGKTLKVLFEKRDGEYLIGHAGDYLKVKVKTADNLIGEIVTIKIDKYDEILEGRVV